MFRIPAGKGGLTVQILLLTPFEGLSPASKQKSVPASFTEVDPLWTVHL